MLLLLHGALGARDQLAPLEGLLAAHRAHAIDFAGHGARTRRGALRIERLVEETIGDIEAEATSPIDLFGYSMGGYVALMIAAQRPDLVRRVATLGTKFAWTPEVARRESAQLDVATLRDKVPRFAALLDARHVASGWEQVLADTAELMHGIAAHPPLTPALFATIAAPVRCMVGDRDATVSVAETADAVSAMPHGELEVLPRTPHPFERVALPRLAFSLGEFFAAR